MVVTRLIILAAVAFALASRAEDSSPPQTAGPQDDSQLALNFPAFIAREKDGKSLPLFSRAAYQAEFRYLRASCRKLDLSGPAVETDGWTHNIPEAEWPLMSFSYFGYACANLAKYDPSFRPEALAEMRWLIAALQTPRLSGFIVPDFGPPFGTNSLNPSVFVHGHFLNLALRYREVSEDTQFDPVIHRVAEAFAREFARSDQGILKTYSDMWWLSDNCPALSSLVRYDEAFHTNLSAVKARFLKNVKADYLDPNTGLLCTYIDPARRQQLQGARGVSTMYALIYLSDIDSTLAKDQFERAKSFFVRDALGLAAVREFPDGVEEMPDVDSGPLVLGFGPSAGGFAIAAAAVMDDRDTAWRLIKASTLVAVPILGDGELHFNNMPIVGQSVILYGKTLLLAPETVKQ